MTWFGMIAFKEEGVDTCRGCVMDRWSGEQVFVFTEDLTELLQAYAPLALREYDQREPHFEFTFLIDGQPIYPDWTPDEENEKEMALRRALYEAADKEVEAIKQRKIAQAAREQEERRLREIREAEERERQERATFARLMAKYGDEKNGTR